jgi:hypothetical protein
MNLFTKTIKTEKEPMEIKALTTIEPEEKWIWVEGYKGTDKNMQGYGNFQFEIGKRYDIPEGQEIEACSNGFHLCKNLPEVFLHYCLGFNNRFFKVKALVKEKDYIRGYSDHPWRYFSVYPNNKIVAKSIILEEEIDTKELIIAAGYDEEFTDEDDWMNIRFTSIEDVRKDKKRIHLIDDCGFSFAFANLIIEKGLVDKALAIGSQNGLSMDMKAYLIFKD